MHDGSVAFDESTYTYNMSQVSHQDKRLALRKKYGQRFDNREADS